MPLVDRLRVAAVAAEQHRPHQVGVPGVEQRRRAGPRQAAPPASSARMSALHCCSDRTPTAPRPQRLDALHTGRQPLHRGHARHVGAGSPPTGSPSRRAAGCRPCDTPCGVLKIRSTSPSRIACTTVFSPFGPGPLGRLADHRDVDVVAAQHLRGALGGQHREAEVGEPLDREDRVPLVAVGDRDEHGARRSARRRTRRSGSWRRPCRRSRRGPSPRRSTSSPGRAACRPRSRRRCGTG